MIARSYQIDDALKLKPLAPEGLTEALKDKHARIWLDLQAPEPAELEAWLDRLEVKGLARRLCLEARDRPGFYPMKSELFLVIPALTGTKGPVEADYLASLCREKLLITMHGKSIPNLEGEDAIQDSESWLPEGRISGLVSAMMIDLSLTCLQRAADLRNSVHAIEERMERDPESVEADDIMDLRSDLLALGAAVSDQLPSQQALSRTDRPFFNIKAAGEYLNCALANLQAADASLGWLGQRISALRTGFQMHAQDKTNRRLNMLTILSAIFMPITLLAGIWGMNFVNMPELKYVYSYPVALGLMVLIGSGMYLYFRRTGWLD